MGGLGTDGGIDGGTDAGASCDAGIDCGCDGGQRCERDPGRRDRAGYEGGPCRREGRCEAGLRCDTAVDLCLRCELGSAGCTCRDGACASGLACEAGVCTDPATLPLPDAPCYTPCRTDLVGADGVTICDADGLLAGDADGLVDGCLEGRSCVEGSCLREGEKKKKCTVDADCPFFQACLGGGCYSNCELDDDCPPEQGCHRKVCRTPCDGSQGGAECALGYSCDAADGANGFCSPISGSPRLGASGDEQQEGEDGSPVEAVPNGGFRLKDRELALSNVRPEVSIPVFSQGSLGQDVVVRKLWHTVYGDGGPETVDARTGTEACEGADCPLYWLELSDGDETTKDPSLTIKVPGDCEALELCPQLTVKGAGDVDAVRWEGALELCSSSGCSDPVTLSYVEQPEGQWTGTLHYFGSFGGGESLRAWRDDPNNDDKAGRVGNALVRKWAEFKAGGLMDGWDEFLAILKSTRERSWDFDNVKDLCGGQPNACYPYTNEGRVRTYTNDQGANPIPSGEARFPVALNLAVDEDDGRVMRGRIASEVALQYPGHPEVSLRFVADPADPDACDEARSEVCAVFMDRFAAEVTVGGRYYTDGSECPDGFDPRTVPWLVPGFEQGTAFDSEIGRRHRYECRDKGLPYPASVANGQAMNAALAGANPVPDGRERTRKLQLLGGVLVDQAVMFVLFEEAFESFIPGQAQARAYGYMLLRKSPATLEPQDFVGRVSPEVDRDPQSLGVACTQDILDRTSVSPRRSDLGSLGQAALDAVATELMYGPTVTVPGSAASAPASGWEAIDPSAMHWYCEETGLIDGGARGDVPCPKWAKVTFFAVDPAYAAAEPFSELRCNQRPNPSDNFGADASDEVSCHDTMQRLRGGVIEDYDPHFVCDGDAAFCDPSDGLDYLADKTFYRRTETEADRDTLPPLLTSLAQAFRYKIRFQSSSGGALGFAPQVCIPGSDQLPYCYEPPVIEEIRGRVDCLIELYSHHASELSADVDNELNQFLRGSFSSFKRPGTQSEIHEGFERLYAELLVMLGDEALTAAYASRFDLAGVAGAAFEGSKFEQEGIDLTGVAGFEMVSLYRAVQYYQLALDRLYQMGPDYAAALGRPGSTDDTTSFVSPETVTTYLERLVRAATQKARAQGEIAKHYQEFDRADLARAVLERAYTGTYLESVMLSDLMVSIQLDSQDKNLDEIRKEIEAAQLRYRMALLDMRDIYDTVTDTVTYFGFAPDYIPLPALDSSDFRQTNAYESLSATARQRVSAAREREQVALQSNRSQHVDTATFQGELVRVRNTYENRLSDLCGTFEGNDGEIHPAIRTYAHLSDDATLYGDPCGRLGNGAIHAAAAGSEDARIALRNAIANHRTVLDQIEIEHAHMSKQCGLVDELIAFNVNTNRETLKLQEHIRRARIEANNLERVSNTMVAFLENMVCDPTSLSTNGCPTTIPVAQANMVTEMASNALMRGGEEFVAVKERELAELEASNRISTLETRCDRAEVDARANMDNLLLQLKQADLEVARANYAIRQQVARVGQLQNQAQRWASQQEQAQQLLLDVEVARNDPNVRIYRNDAVINADLAFDDAIRAVYRATRVFEYFTSQTYAKRDQLFLIRMVGAGQYNLSNYLTELDNAFFEFEEQFGVPDNRVQVLSLRDDILRIPLMDDAGAPYSRAKRIELMRARLADNVLLDARGYLTVPFGTSLSALSPLTRNHKVRFIEVDMVGSDVGDTLGRVYLRSAGTGVVHNLDDHKDYFVLPARTAVIDTFFNGNRVFAPDVYRSSRLRDRPLVNTLWELVINHRDEQVNMDIDLQSLTDIRVLIHYTDFTGL